VRRTREFATSIPDDGLSGFVDLDEILLRRQRWGLGDPLQRAGADGLIDIPFPDMPPKFDATHKAFLARIVEEVRSRRSTAWCAGRARDLTTRLHEEFGRSVSDDTIYKALKGLSFSHLRARPKAYKQDAKPWRAFKKISPSVWRKSARNLSRAHR
jgi:putative transposase